jgi:hypothetical protein
LNALLTQQLGAEAAVAAAVVTEEATVMPVPVQMPLTSQLMIVLSPTSEVFNCRVGQWSKPFILV